MKCLLLVSVKLKLINKTLICSQIGFIDTNIKKIEMISYLIDI